MGRYLKHLPRPHCEPKAFESAKIFEFIRIFSGYCFVDTYPKGPNYQAKKASMGTFCVHGRYGS